MSMTHDPKAMLELAQRLRRPVMMHFNAEQTNAERRYAADLIESLADENETLRSTAAHQSAPAVQATHNPGEGLSNSNAASAGAGTGDMGIADHPLLKKAYADLRDTRAALPAPVEVRDISDKDMRDLLSSKDVGSGRAKLKRILAGYETFLSAAVVPVAWRWKYKDSKEWAYCEKYPSFKSFDQSSHDCERLYAAAPAKDQT